MSDIGVRGAEDLEQVAKALKAAGAGDLRKELLRGIREAGKPVVAKVKSNAAAVLPSGGGLAARVAGSKFSVRTRLSGKSAGVRITAANQISVIGLDRGRLRHPVFGNKDVWVTQPVPDGWFTTPIEGSVDEFRRGIRRVMADVANKIEGAP